ASMPSGPRRRPRCLSSPPRRSSLLPELANSRPELVDAETLAGDLGVSRTFVYEHKELLGALPLGTGPKPRLRFDPAEARRRLARLRAEPEQPKPSSPKTRRRTQAETPDVTLLPIRGSTARSGAAR